MSWVPELNPAKVEHTSLFTFVSALQSAGSILVTSFCYGMCAKITREQTAGTEEVKCNSLIVNLYSQGGEGYTNKKTKDINPKLQKLEMKEQRLWGTQRTDKDKGEDTDLKTD